MTVGLSARGFHLGAGMKTTCCGFLLSKIVVFCWISAEKVMVGLG
jgi:hypothetical protein